MSARISQSHRFDQGMQTKSAQNSDFHALMQMMRMAMLHAHRDDIQRDLDKEPSENQQADQQIVVGGAGHMAVVQFRQQMQQRKTKQIGAGECIENFYMVRRMKLEGK